MSKTVRFGVFTLLILVGAGFGPAVTLNGPIKPVVHPTQVPPSVILPPLRAEMLAPPAFGVIVNQVVWGDP